MTGNTLGWVIVAFVLYLLMMIAIGAFYAKEITIPKTTF